jgi:hypothetical protein
MPMFSKPKVNTKLTASNPTTTATSTSHTNNDSSSSLQSPVMPTAATGAPVVTQNATAIATLANTSSLTISPISRRPTDPNVSDSRIAVQRQCIYERPLPGGAYITAHVDRLQHGFVASPNLTDHEIDHVDFVSINFNLHPSHAHQHRFKSAIIRLSVRDADDIDATVTTATTSTSATTPTPSTTPIANGTDSNGGLLRRSSILRRDRDQDRDRVVDAPNNRRQSSFYPYPHHHAPRTPHYAYRHPRFIAYAPHLIYGAVSPETLQWNFSIAGSLGVSETPVTASVSPSGGVRGQYQLYEMLKIQSSVRTLASPRGPHAAREDAELVWSLEENRLQRSGLPREFTFPFMIAKPHRDADLLLTLDIVPDIDTWYGSYSPWHLSFAAYQPLPKPLLNFRHELGQRFTPVDPDRRHFNFAQMAGSLDSYVNMPGSTYNSNVRPTF